MKSMKLKLLNMSPTAVDPTPCLAASYLYQRNSPRSGTPTQQQRMSGRGCVHNRQRQPCTIRKLTVQRLPSAVPRLDAAMMHASDEGSFLGLYSTAGWKQ